MTVKVIQCDHKKRIDGYWSELKQLADRWEKDLSDLKDIYELSEEEAAEEGEVLELLWDFMEEVDRLANNHYWKEE